MKKRTIPNKKIKWLLFIITLTILISVLVWFFFIRNNEGNKSEQPNGNSGESTVNLNPPTEEELSETEEFKENLSNQPKSTDNGSTKNVTPVITYADDKEVNAYISGIFEEGGICTANLSKGSEKITKTSKGFQNVSYTSCIPILLDGSLSSGEWSVTVSYKSSNSEGISEVFKFKVQ